MNQKIGDLEFRWLLESSRNAEIIRWQDSKDFGKTCYTLAWWIKDKEGYNIQFLGDRPLSYEVDQDYFWELVKYGQKICEAKFQVEDYIQSNNIREK